MQDKFPLFKILIVLAVIAYQGIQVLRKKGKKIGTDPAPPVERPTVEEPDFQARTPEDDAALERVRTLMHSPSVQQPVQSPVPTPVVSATQVQSTSGPTLWDPRTTAALPSLRDLVLAQVIFSPPPSRRSGGQARSPLEIRR
jgi:hypothetical protein